MGQNGIMYTIKWDWPNWDGNKLNEKKLVRESGL